MPRTAISTRQPEVFVEYDCRGNRKRVLLPAWKAKQLFVQKLKCDRNPKLIKNM